MPQTISSAESNDVGVLPGFFPILGEPEGRTVWGQRVVSLSTSVARRANVFATRPKRGRSGNPGNELEVGTVFAGRYEIQSLLGRGGMGIVYKARDRELDDLVAIKILRSSEPAADPSLLDRFKQEIRLARRITHPNVLRTHDLGEADGLRFISMEYVEGPTLKHVFETDDLLPTSEGLRVARQICAGLAAAHEVGVVHRDVKPQNIIIEPNGGLKIVDFGTARLTGDLGVTATGTILGTPDYMSPEQARGLPLDFRSDIYSTGVVLYEMFTGSLPFEGDSPLAVVLKHLNEPPPLPQSKNPRIDPRLAAVVVKCMEKNPDARFQTVGKLCEAM